MNIVGIDACKMGWCVIGSINEKSVFGCFENLEQIIVQFPNVDRILIDIPIGLSSANFKRTVDAKARQLLSKRKSSIFSPSCREALYARNYKAALGLNRQICGKGISIQAYNIGPKIKEVDEWFNTKPKQIQVYEAHPELCFKTLNQNQDLEFSKHDKAGIEERKNILFRHHHKLSEIFDRIMKEYKRKQVKPDDILDAMALFLVNLKNENLNYVEDVNAVDQTDKKVRIVYG